MDVNLTQSSRRQACHSFLQALGDGDLDAATACFARDACLITPDATAVGGRERIRSVLAQLIARHTEIRVDFSNILISGDVALACELWMIRCDGIEGSRFEQASAPMLVLRQVEGEWKLAIAAFWGWGRLGGS
ncbi:MAG TPA: nuclear transport factor 2 family protein [Solirubrobacterales bacterium]